MTSDYFGWIDRHTRRRHASAQDVAAETEELVAPEPLEVQEHHASTTIVERIRDAIRNRLRGEP